MLENEVNLICGPTFVRSKHDRIRRLVVKFLSHPSSLLWSKIFEIGTTTFEPILEASLKLKDNSAILEADRAIKLFHYCILPGLLTHKKPIVIMSLTLRVLPHTLIFFFIRNDPTAFERVVE